MAKEKTEQVSARRAAELVLFENGRPMHYKEITREMLERGIVRVREGASEEATMKTVRSYLAGLAAEGAKFKRLEPGTFELRASARRKIAKELGETSASTS